MKQITLTLAVVFSLLTLQLQAQETNYVLGELLVQVYPNTQIREVIYDLQMIEGQQTSLKLKKKVSDHMRIWLLEFDESTINQSDMLNAIFLHQNVSVVQNNHKITYRNTPNDPSFNQQWQYINTGQTGGTIGADIDADSAWDISTGGLTALGDTIVVCVIDGGIDLNHNDLTPNRWVNYAEIPNNGIDDDGNGFVDDRLGWSTSGQNDNIGGSSHGTAVAGIIGAKGNNGIGVAGINWDVKLMIVRGGTGVESEVLEAYTYPLNLRKQYNETGGAQGAFVVATNASWGINNGQPANAPLWCAMYDTLGHYGILNAGAGPNANFNVDVVGDLPTACPSEYLVTLTNMNHNDTKVNQAGYGITTIDLGAFGEGTYTTTNNGYAGFGGTSGATPHVTGTIALLYSAPCPSFAAIAKANPSGAAALARDYILDNVDPNTSLNGITVTGGRLNVFNAMRSLMDSCTTTDCLAPFGLTATSVIDTSATVTWGAVTDTTTTFHFKYRILGDTIWNVITDTLETQTLMNLSSCSTYEMQVEMVCDSSITISGISTFSTDGCCTFPTGLDAFTLSDTTADLSWAKVLAANEYIVRYREIGAASWIVDTTTTLNYTAYGLINCSSYEFQVATVCDTGVTAFSVIMDFESGCGNCTAMFYCASDGSTQFEYINNISLNGATINSGDNQGYYKYVGIFTSLDKTSYNLTVTPGFNGNPFGENLGAWIDFNQDGDFTDAGEQIFAASGVQSATTQPFSVPHTAIPGITRMRVMLDFNNAASSCSSGIEGETEDYCINITNFIPCEIPQGLDTVATSLNAAHFNWTGQVNDSIYIIRYRMQGATFWTYMNTSMLSDSITGLVHCTAYEVEIASLCTSGDTSAYSNTFTIQTQCIDGVNIIQPSVVDLKIFPNPFSNDLNIELNILNGQEITIQMYQINGQLIKEQSLGWVEGEQQIQLNVGDKAIQGIYLLKIITEEGILIERVVKL